MSDALTAHSSCNRGDLVVAFTASRIAQVAGPAITYEQFRIGKVYSRTRDHRPNKLRWLGSQRLEPIPPSRLSAMVFSTDMYDVLAILSDVAESSPSGYIDRDQLQPLLDRHRIDDEVTDLDREPS